MYHTMNVAYFILQLTDVVPFQNVLQTSMDAWMKGNSSAAYPVLDSVTAPHTVLGVGMNIHIVVSKGSPDYFSLLVKSHQSHTTLF